MHDIDRTQLEYAQQGEFEADEFEQGWSGESDELYGETVLGEADEAELASELLEVTNEQELDQFLGNLLGRAASAVGAAAQSPLGQALGGVLKGVAKKALPLAGGAVGAYVGGPLGARIGQGLASAAGDALGLEAESGEFEDREFQGAKQFVRLAADAVQQAAQAPAGASPRAVAQRATVGAARRLAPGLIGGGAGRPMPIAQAGAGMGRSGRWIRRGNRIILYGV